MTQHELTLPITETQARALRVGDTVVLQGTVYGIRDATQIALFDRGRTTRFDLAGHAVLHTAPNVKKIAPSKEHPTGYAPICVGTTTSARMERFTRPLMAQYGVRLIIGKGGLGAGSLGAFQELGGAYLAAIEDVDLDDLNPESLWRFRVRSFGPLRVAMDSHGASVYATVGAEARARRAEALAALGVKAR
jgi:L(+)-tartrate dehydratase beta subunit